MNKLTDLVKANRSYRRYDESISIPKDKLIDWVDLGHLTASARNLQPIKYFISNQEDTNKIIFNNISWAGYLDNGRPEAGECPTAYIVLLNDHTIAPQSQYDQGIIAQTILLSAVAEGFGGCMFTSVKKKELREALSLPENLEPQMVISIGKPVETVKIADVVDGNIKYYRDKNQTHFVPKRNLKDVIVNLQ